MRSSIAALICACSACPHGPSNVDAGPVDAGARPALPPVTCPDPAFVATKYDVCVGDAELARAGLFVDEGDGRLSIDDEGVVVVAPSPGSELSEKLYSTTCNDFVISVADTYIALDGGAPVRFALRVKDVDAAADAPPPTFAVGERVRFHYVIRTSGQPDSAVAIDSARSHVAATIHGSSALAPEGMIVARGPPVGDPIVFDCHDTQIDSFLVTIDGDSTTLLNSTCTELDYRGAKMAFFGVHALHTERQVCPDTVASFLEWFAVWNDP